MPERSSHQHDQDFADLRSRYKNLPQEQPSAALTAKVLDQAEQALGARQPGVLGRIRSGTTALVAAAACAVLAIGIAVSLKDPTAEVPESTVPLPGTPVTPGGAGPLEVEIPRARSTIEPKQSETSRLRELTPQRRPEAAAPRPESAPPAAFDPAAKTLFDSPSTTEPRMAPPDLQDAADSSAAPSPAAGPGARAARVHKDPSNLLERAGAQSESHQDRRRASPSESDNAATNASANAQPLESQVEAEKSWNMLIESARAAQRTQDRDAFEKVLTQIQERFPNRSLPPDIQHFRPDDGSP